MIEFLLSHTGETRISKNISNYISKFLANMRGKGSRIFLLGLIKFPLNEMKYLQVK